MKDLVQIIKDNPGCVAIIDNDSWTLHRKHPYGPDSPDEDTVPYEEVAAWHEANQLASDGEIAPLGEGDGLGPCYGGDVLEALAQIVGMTVEPV
jgi:hypothetical protein